MLVRSYRQSKRYGATPTAAGQGFTLAEDPSREGHFFDGMQTETPLFAVVYWGKTAVS